MIEFKRDSKRSIQLKLDNLAASQLAQAFEDALNGRVKNTLKVDCIEVFGKKKCVPYLTIVKGKPRLSKTDSGGILSLEEDDLVYGKEKLLEAIEEGYIEPAEFTRVMTDKYKELDDIFWELLI